MKIKPLEPGSKRTLLSAHTGNELINAINALSTMTGENGITVNVSGSNVVISLDPSKIKAPVIGGGGDDTSSLSWGGEWDAGEDYALGTLVIVDEDSDIEDGNLAGQYIALLDAPIGTPKPGTTGSETFWQLTARGNWDRLVFSDADPRAIDVNINGQADLPEIVLHENRDSGGAIIAIRVDDAAGKLIKLREVGVCVDGEQKRMLVLGSIPYDA